MEQLFFVERGRVEWRSIPEPELVERHDALVRPITVATCDVDTGLVHGQVPFEGPFPLGHEGVGEVVAVGADVTSVHIGQRVVIPFQISCGQCRRCARGLTAHCERTGTGAMYGLEPFGGPWGGFLADVVRVPWADHMLVPLPDGVDPVAVASLSDNICDGWRTVAPFVGDDPAGTALLVVGGTAPSIQFYAVAIARALGVGRVDYVDLRGTPGATDKAARLGATIVDGEADVATDGYTLTVCAAGDVPALHLALRATEPDGTCVVNAVFFDDAVPLPMFSMYTGGVRLVTGLVNARSVMPRALELIQRGTFAPETVTDAVVGWDAAADALVAAPQKLVFQR